MRLFYYFIRNIDNNKITTEVTDVFIGDIGEQIRIGHNIYVIEDYAEEFEDLEIPEDYIY